ncbi:hypothetical protein AAKU67_004218 [Oxalobacteraceae bacterium GrIS 2.11]
MASLSSYGLLLIMCGSWTINLYLMFCDLHLFDLKFIFKEVFL